MINDRVLIGLTGNIATGKSVVRRMLVNSGALGIDADTVAHRMLYPNAPAYQPVIDAFGETVLNPDGTIARKKLGQIVFQNPNALKTLEKLIHPAVTRAIHNLIQKSTRKVVVIEAIKLLETSLGQQCDQIWVSHAAPTLQMERLLQKRNMSPSAAKDRISAQPPQAEKLKKAEIVINTEGSFRKTWQQVQKGSQSLQLSAQPAGQSAHRASDTPWMTRPGQMDSAIIQGFLQKNCPEQTTGLYEWLAMAALGVAVNNAGITHLLSWEEWNFTAILNDFIPGKIDSVPCRPYLSQLEGLVRQDMGEILIIPPQTRPGNTLGKCAFGKVSEMALHHPAWQEAVQKSRQHFGSDGWVKVLSQPFETGLESE